ncbi:hypothetical protein [uncultured Jannaschia sp.]|uniref:hypothetical protein n=1 Tax=uncultured Jannaschia sp. TaxID=293347 RepID=UPI002639694F|nr:hypothetical protein [uncultured Jannaschia sp.]
MRLVGEQKIEPHIPVFDKTARKDGTFQATDFVFDAQANEYTCPNGKKLKKYWRTMTKPRSSLCKDNTYRYFASKADYFLCAFKARCMPV